MKRLLIKIIAKCVELRTKWRGNQFHFISAIKRAERNGRRSYVYFLGGRYHVLTRKDIQRLKVAGVFRHHMSVDTMRCVQLYDTQGHINSHPLYTNITLKGVPIVYKPQKELSHVRNTTGD
ncbi:MAG: hypothetical protein BWY89_00045 [Bacteroidetes bacterium ADurb.BinA012]|jgi:hypothetical protein|nr:MAG: hypothetical protein BWY89_00045 [Bacteroidetes bacterium ADurb.BinA012]